MRVYRVAKHHERSEYPIGPYKASYLERPVKELLADMYHAHWAPTHPTPRDEGAYMEESDICAFSSEEKLYEWFSGWEMHLDVCDFRIFVYEVPVEYTRELTSQTIVYRHAAQYVTDYALTY